MGSVGSVFVCVCVIMATNVLELATTLKCLGGKKLILRPGQCYNIIIDVSRQQKLKFLLL